MSGSFSRQGRWAAFGGLFAASLILPWSLRTLFSQPSDPADALTTREEMLPEKLAWRFASSESENVRAKNYEDNVAWVRGGTTEVPYEGIISPEGSLLETNETVTQGIGPADAGLAPGIFAAYMRSWDSLDITRQRGMLGVYIYPSPRTRLEGYVSRHQLKDNVDVINGHGGGIDAAHRIGSRWLLEEGLNVNGYDGIRQSLNGFARVGFTPKENLFLSLDAQLEDVWERLPNVRDGLKLWSISPYLYYAFWTNYWIAGYWSLGYFNDHNVRQVLSGELGRFLMKKIGLSLSTGVETYDFREPRDTYWTPSYFRYLFGRIRLSRNFEDEIWERRLRGNFTSRIGYLAEYTAGVTETNDFDQTLRGGLSLRLLDHWTFRAEAYHLNSHGRFPEHYYENRIDGRIDYGF